MADNNIKIVLQATDDASKDIESVGKAMKGLSSQADDAGKSVSSFSSMIEDAKAPSLAFAGVLAAAATAVVAFGASAVSSYNEAALAQAQLSHAILDVTHGTQEQLTATMDLADALEMKGVLDGDNIKLGIAQLSTMGLQNDSVRALAGSLADYAVNQYGVSASGEQLVSAANGISKAFMGNFRAFTDAGIVLSDAQKATLQFGTEMEKVNSINQIFAANLKLTNEVALQTATGSLAHLKVQLGNVSEEIGQRLSPFVTELAVNISNWIDAQGGAIGIVQDLEDKLVTLTGFLNDNREIIFIVAGAIVGALVPAFIAGGTAAWFFVAPLIPFMVVGAAVAGGIFLIVEGVKAAISLFKQFAPIVKTIGEYFKFIMVSGDSLNDSLSELPGPLKGIVKAVGDVVATFVNLYGWFKQILGIGEDTQNFFGGLPNWLQNALNGVMNFANGAAAAWDELKSSIGSIMKGLADGVTGFFVSLWDGVTAVINSIIDGFGMMVADITSVLQFIGGIFEAIWGGIVLVVNTAIALIVGYVIQEFQKMGINIVAVVTTAVSGIVAIWNFLGFAIVQITKNFIDGIMLIANAFAGVWSIFWSSVFDIAKNFVDGIVIVFQAFGNFWLAVWGSIVEVASWAWGQITDAINMGLTLAWSIIAPFLAGVSALWQFVWGGIASFFTNIWTGLTSKVKTGTSEITNTVTPWMTTLSSLWNGFWTAAGNIVTTVWETVKDTVKNGINWVVSKINSMIAAFNSVVSTGSAAIGVKAIQIPSIPMLATGGNVVGSGSVIVGENGPEMLSLPHGASVTPLSGDQGLGGRIEINVSNNTFGKEMDPRDVALAIGDELMRAFKMQARI